MKFTTARNIMASMLVLGAAGSVLAVSNGTFSLFNATTQSSSNTFTTDDLQLDVASCNEATASGQTAGQTAGGCDALMALPHMIPGDSKTFSYNLKNNSANAKFSLQLAVSAPSGATSTLLNTTAPNDSSSGGGLGLLVLRCENSGGTPVSCASGVSQVKPLYASCPSSNAAIAVSGGVFDKTQVSVASTATDDSISIGGTTCHAGNDGAAISSLNGTSNSLGISGPDSGNYNA
ncbi:MAG TPA: hypothetical protein VFS62_02245, partial [Chloroflexota bacterium]|nr:hypothetical protein [Chloroflexota bacterium]